MGNGCAVAEKVSANL